MRVIFILLCMAVCLSCERKMTETNASAAPIDVEAEFNEALALLDNREYEQAQKKFLMLDDAAPGVVGVKMNLSVIAEKIGMQAEAIKYAEEAFQLAPNNVSVARHLERLTGNPQYEEKVAELENKILSVEAETYFANFKKEASIVNDEYAKFEIQISGVVTQKDEEAHVLYLYGAGDTKEE